MKCKIAFWYLIRISLKSNIAFLDNSEFETTKNKRGKALPVRAEALWRRQGVAGEKRCRAHPARAGSKPHAAGGLVEVPEASLHWASDGARPGFGERAVLQAPEEAQEGEARQGCQGRFRKRLAVRVEADGDEGSFANLHHGRAVLQLRTRPRPDWPLLQQKHKQKQNSKKHKKKARRTFASSAGPWRGWRATSPTRSSASSRASLSPCRSAPSWRWRPF